MTLNPVFYIKQNDHLPQLTSTLLEVNGQRVNLSGATVRFHMALPGDIATVDAAATIVDAPNGEVLYDWGGSDTSMAGTYNAEFEVTFGTGDQETFPNNRYITVIILPQLA